MRSKVGYKVCRLKVATQPVSLMGRQDPRVVAYPMNKWAVPMPGFGPLAVFKKLSDAKAFLYPVWASELWGDHVGIFECRYEPSKEHKLWYLYKPNWSRGAVKAQQYVRSTYPSGTVTADAVKLLKRVA